MTALALVALVALFGAYVVLVHAREERVLRGHERERATWDAERKFLLNRAMARDFGEVIAMERDQQPPRDHVYVPPVEGM